MSKLVPGQVSKLMVAYRLKANLSQAELVARLGYKNVGAQVRISNWERGVTGINLTPAAQKTLAKLLEVSVPDFTKMLAEDMAARKESLSKDKAAKKAAGGAPKAAAAPKPAKKAAKSAPKKAARKEPYVTVTTDGRLMIKKEKPAKKAAQKRLTAQIGREVALQNAGGAVKVIQKKFKTPAKALPTVPPSLTMPLPDPSNGQHHDVAVKADFQWRKTIDPASDISTHEHLAAALMAREPSMAGADPAGFVRLVAKYLALTTAFASV